ncbi:MAG: CRISPR-associated endonuclease Cas1 [Mariprofundaceae bacterium]|nr:CRISPR-associated endonuclease Cas1 [Mariprofundaceae bacterium]
MSTLYLDRKGAKVSLSNRALCVQNPQQKPQRIPLTLFNRVVISCDVDLSSHLLSTLAQSGISTLILIPRKSQGRAFVLGDMHNDITIRLQQYACMQSTDFCLGFSQHLIRAKLLGQQRVLQHASMQHSQHKATCQKALKHIKEQQKKIMKSVGIASLMGMEGAAAHAYFQAYSQLFAPSLNMSGRNKRPPKDPVNVCLSLAYTLLHFEAVHWLHASGLDVMGGLFHQPLFGRESLACDVIEPFRPKVDVFVLRLFVEKTLRPEHFSTTEQACMLQKAGRQHFYHAYEQWAKAIRRLMRLESRRLVSYLRGYQA